MSTSPERSGLFSCGASLPPSFSPAEADTIDATGRRVNDEIHASPVRLVGPEGELVGVVSLEEARTRAAGAGLDLVEVAPHVAPPVVKLMEPAVARAGRGGDSRCTEPPIPLKEVRFRPGFDEVDQAFKIRHGRRFLEDGHRVAFVVPLPGSTSGDEAGTLEFGDRIARELKDVGSVEVRPSFEGRTMRVVLAPLKSR